MDPQTQVIHINPASTALFDFLACTPEEGELFYIVNTLYMAYDLIYLMNCINLMNTLYIYFNNVQTILLQMNKAKTLVVKLPKCNIMQS